MEYGLLGEKLGHSFSPQIHSALADYRYELLPTPTDEVEALFRLREFKGLNVTIPYKQTVMPLCDEIDPAAAEIGAVNTVVKRGCQLIGFNTDIDGMIYMARRAGVEMAGKKVLIMGSGGTSRTARAAARKLEAGEIIVISRSGEDNYENISRHSDAQVIINTTPVGMYPNCGVSPVDLEIFPDLIGVLDVVYNPLRTALIQQAERRNIPCSCGLPMLVAQAKRAAELFLDTAIPDCRIEEILSDLTQELQNIVLIGMPGCGKSTVGRMLAGELGKNFIDLDEEIVNAAGTSIPDIFARGGEDSFRKIESQVVQKFGMATGCVISTGGGVVTRPENYAPLHQNAVILHLTRDLTCLPVEGRPLSQSTALDAMWQKRAPLYAAFADIVIDNNGSLVATVERIKKELEKV